MSKKSQNPTLKIENLTHTYSDQAEPVTVLKGIDAEFKPGKLYAICGESGSGKTTLLSLLSALDEVQDGDIAFGGKSIKEIGYGEFRLHCVNVVFQSYNLIKYMTGLENVLVAVDFADEHKEKKRTKAEKTAAALAALAEVGLDESTSRRLVGKLSGGQQQRVAIARALASNSPIVVGDEPTGNLDEDTEAKIIEIFQKLAHDDDKIVILVTHSSRVAKNADVVLRLERGKLSREKKR